MIDKLTVNLKKDLMEYPYWSKKEWIKYAVKRILRPRVTAKRDSFFWTHGLITQALEEAGEDEALKEYYDRWVDKGLPMSHPDHIINGYSLIYLHQKTKNVKYRHALDKVYNYTLDYMGRNNDLIYRKHHPTHVYVDGIGMVVPFLCRYGSVYNVEEAIDKGEKILLHYLAYGMDENTGLPYHGYDMVSKVKYGIIGWGRAAGWLILSLADMIEYLPETKGKGEIIKSYNRLINCCLRYQRENGNFSWQLSCMEGPIDTSAAAMIGYGLAKAVKLGIIEEKENIMEALKKIREALEESYEKGRIYNASGECEGYSQYPQVYGSYPWSNAPTLRLFSIMRN